MQVLDITSFFQLLSGRWIVGIIVKVGRSFISFLKVLFMCLGVCLYVCLCTACMPGAQRVLKRVVDPLGLGYEQL